MSRIFRKDILRANFLARILLKYSLAISQVRCKLLYTEHNFLNVSRLYSILRNSNSLAKTNALIKLNIKVSANNLTKVILIISF